MLGARLPQRFLITAISAATFLVSATTAQADKRVAFVVGNGAYKNVAALPNPAIDAKSMAKLLRNVGFEVVEGSNLTRDKVTERLLDFGKKAEGADVGLCFCAGQGIAVNGTNYLLFVPPARLWWWRPSLSSQCRWRRPRRLDAPAVRAVGTDITKRVILTNRFLASISA